MSSITSTITESIPTEFGDHRWLAVAGAVAVGGLLVDRFKQSQESNLQQTGLPLADPEIAALAVGENRSFINRERVAHYSAVGFLALGALHLAEPLNVSTEKTGSVSVVIDGGYRADAKDMTSDKTRLQASIDGALLAAENRDVAMSIIIAGNTTRPVTQLPEENKLVSKARKEISETLKDASFRNGESIAEAVIQAQGLSTNGTNKTIVLAANPGSASERPKITAVQAKTKSVYAIVTGQGESKVTVGNISINSSTDPAAFEALLGKANVKTAKSSQQIAGQIEKIIDTNLIRKTTNPNQLPGKGAVGLAILGAGVAILRRSAGIIDNRRNVK